MLLRGERDEYGVAGMCPIFVGMRVRLTCKLSAKYKAEDGGLRTYGEIHDDSREDSEDAIFLDFAPDVVEVLVTAMGAMRRDIPRGLGVIRDALVGPDQDFEGLFDFAGLRWVAGVRYSFDFDDVRNSNASIDSHALGGVNLERRQSVGPEQPAWPDGMLLACDFGYIHGITETVNCTEQGDIIAPPQEMWCGLSQNAIVDELSRTFSVASRCNITEDDMLVPFWDLHRHRFPGRGPGQLGEDQRHQICLSFDVGSGIAVCPFGILLELVIPANCRFLDITRQYPLGLLVVEGVFEFATDTHVVGTYNLSHCQCCVEMETFYKFCIPIPAYRRGFYRIFRFCAECFADIAARAGFEVFG